MASFSKPKSLAERLADEARLLREEAKLLPPGAVREATIRAAWQADTAARQADTASHLDDWANSPGLQPPN